MFDPITVLKSKIFSLDRRDVDTDQIIPARFLTTTSRDGMGEGAFYDWRFDENGNPKDDNPFKGKDISEQTVLVAGDNFGCGSSREHAPWALSELGFQVVISTRIADIFQSNSLKNGLLVIELPADDHAELMRRDGDEITVDLESEEIRSGNHVFKFSIDPFARRCLMAGSDTLGVLLEALPEIAQFEEANGR